MPSMVSPRPRAPARTASMSPTIVSRARPGPAPWVGACASTSTSPSLVTSPAAVVVPPTSTPSSPPPGLEVTERAETDAERRGGGTGGVGAEADQLHLALARVAAIGQIVVEPAGVRHELRQPRGQRAKVRA